VWPRAGFVVERRILGMFASVILVFLSISRSYMEGGITTEVWAYLLLTPIPVAIALTSGDRADYENGVGGDWDDSEDELREPVEEPLEMGFDIPIL